MQDGIMKESGDSRYLRSINGLLAMCPTYESFVRALVEGTLPIDLNGINEDGWTQLGTPLNKANLLTDSTAALAGLSYDATPNQMFAALANKLKTVDSQLENLDDLISYGTASLTAGSSNLATGTIYVKYE